MRKRCLGMRLLRPICCNVCETKTYTTVRKDERFIMHLPLKTDHEIYKSNTMLLSFLIFSVNFLVDLIARCHRQAPCECKTNCTESTGYSIAVAIVDQLNTEGYVSYY